MAMFWRRVIAIALIVGVMFWFALTGDGPDGSASTAASQTTYLRIVVIILCGWVTYEAYRLKRAVENPRFSRLAYNIFFLFLIFTGLRSIAALLDSYYAFSIGWFSSIVNCGFYAYGAILIRKQRKLFELSERQPDADGRRRISAIADEYFDEVEKIGERLHRTAGANSKL